jgi:hypothetical protein
MKNQNRNKGCLKQYRIAQRNEKIPREDNNSRTVEAVCVCESILQPDIHKLVRNNIRKLQFDINLDIFIFLTGREKQGVPLETRTAS